MRRIRIRTTEIEVDLEDSQVETLITRALSATPTLPELAPAATEPQPTDYTVPEVTTEARTPATSKKARPKARKSSTAQTRPGGAGANGRAELMSQIVHKELSDHERYVKALREHRKAGKRAFVVLHLARETFNEKGLSSVEVAKVLEDKFSVAEKEHAIRMALVRAASNKPFSVATKKVDGHTIFWLTADGMTEAKALLGKS